MKRRKFIQQAGIFSASSLVAVGSHAWFSRTISAAPNSKRLIVIFLRGAVDGT